MVKFGTMIPVVVAGELQGIRKSKR